MSATPKPPARLVPTLTEVVHPRPLAQAQPPVANHTEPVPASRPDRPGADAELVDRVVWRVDSMLERRLRETVSAVVIEQALQMTPLLKNELGAMIHELVARALAEEMDARPNAQAKPPV